MEGPKEFRVKKGEDVTMEVQFKATPPPTAEWTVNGTVVVPSKKVCLNFLMIASLSKKI